jgi:MFS transporter, PHS family, inorganic phosphate transporter
MSQTPLSETDILSRMDDSEITKQHWKIMFISGMGFFTDAYGLFIIGVVMSILKDEWHPSPVAVGLVTSTALLASVFGAILFGRVADMLGRKRIYDYEVLMLAAGAIASAFSPDIRERSLVPDGLRLLRQHGEQPARAARGCAQR